MKKKVFLIGALVASIVMSAVGAAGCTKDKKWVEQLPESFINETLDFELTADVETPKPDASSHRGEEIENLVVKYGQSYENDEYLKDDVVLFRRWQWEALYNSLSKKAKDNPAYLNTYRLQAEAYLIKSEYQAALAALDKVLSYHHDDVYALGLSAYVQNILGNTAQRDARLKALKNVSQKCHDDLYGLMAKVTGWIQEDHGTEKLDGTGRLPYDAIGILGVAPSSDGKLQGSGATRVKAAFKAAYYSDEAKIIPSGGAIDTEYSEAKVMGDYIVRNSAAIAESLQLNPADFCVYGDDVILDEQARDTVGNAIGICNVMVANDLHNLLIIASEDQVMRAECIFKAYIDANNLDITLSSHSAGGNSPSANQTRYSYVCAASAYGLFTKDDYAEHSKYVIETTNGLTKFEGKVEVDKATSNKGETINYSAVPAAGYEVDSVEIKTSSGKTVAANNGSFTMPEESVIISAKFKRIAGTVTLDFYNNDTFGTTQNGITSVPDALKACENDIKSVNSGLVSVTDNIAEDPLVTGNNALGYGKMGGFGLAAGGRIGGFKLNFKEDYKISKIQVTAVKFSENEGHLQVNGINPTSGSLQGEANVFDCSYYVEYAFETPTNTLDFRTVADTVDGSTNYGRVIIYSVTLFLEDAAKVDTVYSVNVAPCENGKVTSSFERAVAGTVVTLETKGDKGYYIDTLKVTCGTEEVEVNDNQFIMPEGDVTVTATFVSRISAETKIEISNGALYSDKVAGEITLNKESYSTGDTATFSVKTGHGFELENVTVKTVSGKNVTVNNSSFTVPDEDFTVTATYKMTAKTFTISFFNDGTFGTSQNGITNVTNGLAQAETDIKAVNDNLVSVSGDNAPADAALNNGVPNNALGYGKHGGFGLAAGGRIGWFTLTFKEGYNIEKVVVNGVNNSATEGHLQVNGKDATQGTEFTGTDNTFSYDTAAEYVLDSATNVLTFSTAKDTVEGSTNYGRVIIYSITLYLAD